MWPGLIDCLESDLHIKNKLSYLNTLINVDGLNLEVENEISLVKSKVKEFCADVTKRTEGLLLLYAVVHCSSTLYVDNWSQIVLGSLQCPDVIIPKEIPLKVLNRMLINFGGSESVYTDVFSKLINEVFPIILNPEDKIYKFSCQTVAVCMRYAPSVARNHVVGIEKLLLKELDNPYGEIVESIGECFAALPLCILGVPNIVSSDYKEMWCFVFMKILNTIHLLLNNLMRLSEDQAEFFDVSGLPMFDIPSSESNNPVVQIDIFKSLCHCMAKMISSENAEVRLPITELLKTLFRVFSIEKIVKGQNQDATIGCLKLCFPQMLNGVYVVLEALILNFVIIDQSHNFVVLMNMSLNAMEETFSQTSSVSQVRGSTWKLINVWLKQYGSKGSSGISKNKNIILEVLKDIEIEENVKSKQLKTSNVKETNQKANKVFACTHALKVLKSLAEIGGGFMEKNDLDKICSALLRIAKIVLRHMLPKIDIPFPYSDEKCRKMLFDALCIYAIYSDPLHSKCIMETQNIFNNASRDTNGKVGRLCHRFRKLSRYYLNPRKPPPDAIQYSHPSMRNTVQPTVIDSIKSEWRNVWNSTNGHSGEDDEMMEEGEVAQVQVENAYSDKSEDMLPIEEQTEEESESHMNHDYRRIAKQSSQSMGEEESIDDSDIEPTYVSTDSNPQRIGLNDSSRINSFGMQSCVEQYANETRTERHASEAVVPNLTNNVENNIGEHVSDFVEVKSAGQKPPQAPMGNGIWRKKSTNESQSDESDVEEEGDEEAEVSDNAGDEASDGKHSSEFDEERPSKRRKCMDEEGDDDMDEELEDDDIPVNNQSSDEEGNEVNNVPVLEQNAEAARNLIDEESHDDNEDTDCKSPTIRQMCGDFVLAEPSIPDIS